MLTERVIPIFGLLFALQAQATANEVWLAGLDPFVRQVIQPGATSDYTKLFVPTAPWQQAATSLKVFKTSTQWVTYAPDNVLSAMFSDLKRRGIGLAIEALATPQTSSCGAGVEGYSSPGSMAIMAQRVKNLGGDLKYIAMDEPLWFGHHYQGPNACQSAISNLATSLAVNVNAIRAVFPNVMVGDIEPLSLATVPDWLDELATFATAFQSATGTPLDFLHADVQWSNNSPSELQQFTTRMHAAGIKVGFIYNGDPTDQTDLAWTEHAEARFTSIERSLVADQTILQTWMLRPTNMLPETQAGTMTNLVDRYLAMQTKLSMQNRHIEP
jgi:hypothetical protein